MGIRKTIGDRYRPIIGYALIFVTVLGLFGFIWTARDKLLDAGARLTYEIRAEEYHWSFVLEPRRADDEQAQLYMAAFYMYPLAPQSFLPNVVLQLVLPDGNGPATVYKTSVFLTLLLLSLCFFVALHHGLRVRSAVAVTIAVLVNPFLLTLLISAPVLHASALLPIAYLAYRCKRPIAAFVLFFLVAFSYRAGALVLLGFLLVMRDDEDSERRALNRVLLISMAVFTVYQIGAQFSLALWHGAQRRADGPGLDRVWEIITRVVKGYAIPSSFSVGGKVMATVGWLCMGNLWILSGRKTEVRWVLASGIALYILVVVGMISQAMILFTAVSAILLIRTADQAQAGGLLPIGCRNENSTYARTWQRYRFEFLSLVPVLVVSFLIPMKAPPEFEFEAPDQGVGLAAERVTPIGFYDQVLSFGQSTHVIAVKESLGRIDATTCAVDLFVLPLVTGRSCRRVLTLGRFPADEALARADAIVIDQSSIGRAARDRVTWMGHNDRLARNCEATAEAVAKSSRFTLVSEEDGVLVFRKTYEADWR